MPDNEIADLDKKLSDAKLKIEEILKEAGAALVPVTLISGDKVVSRIDLVPANIQANKS